MLPLKPMTRKKEKRILITGAAGMIGSALAWRLNREGHDNLILCDRLGEDAKWRNLASLRFHEYLDADELAEALRNGSGVLDGVSQVLHMGACSSTTERDAGYLMRNNFAYTRELAAWALERGARFVYASSAATYGDGSAGMADGDAGLDALRPLNAYGYSKHLFDLWALREGLLKRMVGLKYFNVFGPNEHHKGEMRSVVHKAHEEIRRSGRVSLFKSHHPDYLDGCQMRDFLYVKDAVDMTLHLARSPMAGGLYNLGSGQARTWRDLVTPIFHALGRPVEIDYIDMPEHLRGKYQYFTEADISRLRASGYERELTPLAAAVTDYVSNYLETGRHLGDEPENRSVR